MQENLTNEINNRLRILNDIAQNDDELQKLVSDLHQQSEQLMVLGKANRNAGAAVDNANNYYRLMAKAVTGQPTEPMILYPNMTAAQIQLAIKQNELWLLNSLLFLKNGQTTHLFSVVEKTLNWH